MKKGIFVLYLMLTGCFAAEPVSIEREMRAQALMDKGVGMLREGNLKLAKEAFLVAYELFPSAPALDGLGCVALLEEKYSEARSRFEQAIETDPSYGEVLGNLALLEEIEENRVQALHWYEKALQENPSQFQVRGNFGAFLFDTKGRQEEALRLVYQAQTIADHPNLERNIQIMEKE